MKGLKCILIIPGFFLLMEAKAQYYEPSQVPLPPERRQFFIGVNSGLNNFTGLIGGSFEYNIIPQLSAVSGLGLGTWGYKASLGARYYVHFPVGFALELSSSVATGIPNINLNMQAYEKPSLAPMDNVSVPMTLKPIGLINVTGLNFWKLGKYSRFNIEYGYSFSVNGNGSFNYTVNDPNLTLTSQSTKVMSFIQPGGFVFGIGFTFGL